MGKSRGRRPAKADTRAEIAAAARQQFAQHGYPKASIRKIAEAAGVDSRLVLHYFESKQRLFTEVLELPFEPAEVLPTLADSTDEFPEAFAAFVLNVLENPKSRETIIGIIRAAASEDEAAELLHNVVIQRILIPLMRHMEQDNAELRAALVGSQIVGLTMARHIVKVPALVQADLQVLRTVLAHTFRHYMTGPWNTTGTD